MREFHIYLEKHSRYKATPRQNCWWLESQMGDIFVPHQCCWFYRSWAESFMCHSDQMVPDSWAKPAWSVCEGYSPGVHGSLLLPINWEKHPHHWLGSQCIFINLARALPVPRRLIWAWRGSVLGRVSAETAFVCRREKAIPPWAGQKKPLQVCYVLPWAHQNVLSSPDLRDKVARFTSLCFTWKLLRSSKAS